ncbi:MAG: NUDIX hydrolase [Planctomycetota bacterium]
MGEGAEEVPLLPVAVDVVVFTVAPASGERKPRLLALLVKVKEGPFAGHWAFPGGRVSSAETLDEAARRELSAQTGLTRVFLEQLYTFGDPARDPGGRVVSVAYFALVPAAPALRQAARYAEAAWFSVRSLPPLAYDHDRIARVALRRLRATLDTSNVAWSLLPPEFTLGDLERLYEAILGRRLDRRNFRKKALALGQLRPLGRLRRGPHRPGALYAFRSRRPALLSVTGRLSR